MKEREALVPMYPLGFGLAKRLASEFDRLFDDFGFRRPLGLRIPREIEEVTWMPDLEIFEKNGTLFLRADLPGMTKDDVKIEIADNALVLTGERKVEKEEKDREYFRSERAYGSFCRSVPLPEGVKADAVKAAFTNGVLEITVPLPAKQELKPKRVEIQELPEKKAKTAA
jgi:HSP20 family protein